MFVCARAHGLAQAVESQLLRKCMDPRPDMVSLTVSNLSLVGPAQAVSLVVHAQAGWADDASAAVYDGLCVDEAYSFDVKSQCWLVPLRSAVGGGALLSFFFDGEGGGGRAQGVSIVRSRPAGGPFPVRITIPCPRYQGSSGRPPGQ